MTTQTPRMLFVNVSVRNLKRSMAFYTALGLQPALYQRSRRLHEDKRHDVRDAARRAVLPDLYVAADLRHRDAHRSAAVYFVRQQRSGQQDGFDGAGTRRTTGPRAQRSRHDVRLELLRHRRTSLGARLDGPEHGGHRLPGCQPHRTKRDLTHCLRRTLRPLRLAVSDLVRTDPAARPTSLLESLPSHHGIGRTQSIARSDAQHRVLGYSPRR